MEKQGLENLASITAKPSGLGQATWAIYALVSPYVDFINFNTLCTFIYIVWLWLLSVQTHIQLKHTMSSMIKDKSEKGVSVYN